jgi:anti-sigma regulatory factor (Ser/Thr protein kinase)
VNLPAGGQARDVAAAHQPSPAFQQTFPADPASVAVMRRAVRRFAKSAGMNAEVEERMMIAVSEAASNVIHHAHDEGPRGVIGVAGSLTADGVCELLVTDEGEGFRTRAGTPGLGLGLPIIATVCDGLRVEEGPRGAGTRLRMRFRNR